MARLYRCVMIVAITLAVLIAVLPQDDLLVPTTPYSQRMLDAYGLEVLKDSHGSTRNYTHKQVRRLYHELLGEVATSITALSRSTAESERAELCSAMRASVRQYARSRDGSLSIFTDLFLQLRDAYVHGGRYLPLALRRDVEVMMDEHRFTLRRTVLTLKQTRDCAMPFLFGQCPSYIFLREVRGKTDAQILGTCTATNKFFDEIEQ